MGTTSSLSPRQLEVLQHVATGQTNQQIAQDLKISDQTVKNHLLDVRKALKVRNRTAAVVYALRNGWIAFPEPAPTVPSIPEGATEERGGRA